LFASFFVRFSKAPLQLQWSFKVRFLAAGPGSSSTQCLDLEADLLMVGDVRPRLMSHWLLMAGRGVVSLRSI
jgi:hypothetical protein